MSRRVNGAAIRALRAALGLRVSDLAQRAEVSTGYASNIEHGRKQPSPAVAVRLARVLGASLDSITYVVPDEHDTDTRRRGQQ